MAERKKTLFVSKAKLAAKSDGVLFWLTKVIYKSADWGDGGVGKRAAGNL